MAAYFFVTILNDDSNIRGVDAIGEPSMANLEGGESSLIITVV